VIGTKHDGGKIDWTLLPWGPLEEVAKVMEFGRKKYDRDNWQKVKPLKERYLAALLRHVIQYVTGETRDAESGLHHLAHATCCCLFIIWGDYHGEDLSIPTTSERTNQTGYQAGFGTCAKHGEEEWYATGCNQTDGAADR
jgi:hypothetical protein